MSFHEWAEKLGQDGVGRRQDKTIDEEIMQVEALKISSMKSPTEPEERRWEVVMTMVGLSGENQRP